MAVKAIFFDMDGVLVCSEQAHFNAWIKLLSSLNIPLSDQNFLPYVGISDLTMAFDVVKEHQLEIDPMELCNRKREVFLEMIPSGFPVPSGRNEFLQWVSSKFHLMVVSSSSRKEVETILRFQKIDHYFQGLITHEDTPRHKPDPMPYLLALDMSGFSNQEVLVIEDSPVGISAAVRANLSVLGISTTFSSHPEFPKVPIYHDFHSLQKANIF